MASSRDTSNGPDWRDIASALLYFQEDHKLTVIATLSACGSHKAPDLLVQTQTAELLTEEQEVPRSVSVSVRIGRLRVKTLEAAILSALHELDYALVTDELPDIPE